MRLYVLAFVLLAAVATAYFFVSREPAPQPVETVTVTRDAVVSRLSLDGELVNDRTVNITALLDGEITGIAAREGALVAAGDTLATLDDEAAAAQLRRTVAEHELTVAQLQDARRSLQRAQDLSAQGNLAQQALDDALLAVDTARSKVAVADASITISRLQFRDATVRAPFDGVVIEQTVETGQWVEAGTRLFTLVATDGQVVEAYVDASDIARVAIGQAATLSSDAWPSRSWSSVVDWIGPAIATGQRNRGLDVPPNSVAIRLALGGDAPPLRLGQQLDVALDTDHRDAVLNIPLTAMVEEQADRFEVWRVREQTLERVPVSVGLVTTDTAEINDGLTEGDILVLRATNSLRVGDKVVVQ